MNSIFKNKLNLILLTLIILLAVLIGIGSQFQKRNKVNNNLNVDTIASETSTKASTKIETKENSKVTSTTIAKTEPVSTVDKSKWNLLLVDKQNPVKEDFKPELVNLINGNKVDARILNDLQKMINDSKEQNLYPKITNSYKTQEEVKLLFDEEVSKLVNQGKSEEEAKKEVAKYYDEPGFSEFQTGLTMDIMSKQLDKENPKEMSAFLTWLQTNSYKYGFIIRYPEGKESVTGKAFMPWRIRYVGLEAAKEIYEKKITLEEYLK